jgi:hypothetical protein
MRRLRRAHQRHVRREAKRSRKFKQRAVVAGTVAAITLVAGIGLNKALADDHQLPVSRDADADLLANREELAIGYRPFRPDQNRNQILDGVELAKCCAAVVNQLPQVASPNEPYVIRHEVDGVEYCDICGAEIHMGGGEIINPKFNLHYPDPCDPLDPMFLPDLALHYMEHGSFDCYGSIHSGRVDLPRLMRVLGLRLPYDPNEHQLPLDYPDPCDPSGTLAPDTNDLDGDLMADTEELAAGYNLYNPDQNRNLTPDGIELAKQCVAVIDELPVHDPCSDDPTPTQAYKICWFQHGIELCDICGESVNMGCWEVVNPTLGLSIGVYDITCHYMSHGSFSYSGLSADPPYDPFHYGRIDIALLAKILEMPRNCGHLGTMYLPADVDRDCKVSLADIAELADKWLECTDPNEDGCYQL